MSIQPYKRKRVKDEVSEELIIDELKIAKLKTDLKDEKKEEEVKSNSSVEYFDTDHNGRKKFYPKGKPILTTNINMIREKLNSTKQLKIILI